tara:strand:+ start:371 stop:577 length:207 start_codon:yes stop_codon:yes gene_type:complete
VVEGITLKELSCEVRSKRSTNRCEEEKELERFKKEISGEEYDGTRPEYGILWKTFRGRDLSFRRCSNM